jgi:NTE family protein
MLGVMGWSRSVGRRRGVRSRFSLAFLWLACSIAMAAPQQAPAQQAVPRQAVPQQAVPEQAVPQQAVPEQSPAHRLRIGLVLSGGGARGIAHVGVLKVLEQLHIPIDAIAGTSMGAVVGGLYASGLSPEQIEATLRSMNWQGAFRDRPPREDLTLRRKQEDENFLVKFPIGIRAGGRCCRWDSSRGRASPRSCDA